jgi:NAD(P)H-flavin reductase
MYEILSKTEVVPNVYELVIKAPEIAEKAKPGQFVILHLLYLIGMKRKALLLFISWK